MTMIIRLLKKYPLLSGMTSYACVWTVSSITQQKLVSHHNIDYGAVARNATVGCLVMAPLLHGWLRILGRVYGTAPKTWKTSIKVTMLEQILFSPIHQTSFLTSTSLLAGNSLDYIKEELRTKLPRTYLTGWCIFPFVNFVHHIFVPMHLKMMYLTCVSFLWSTFLCLVKEKPLNLFDKETQNQDPV